MNTLRTRILGFPLEVQPAFFLMIGVLGLLGLSWGWSVPMLLATVLVAGTSVLVHELGHAVMARAFGLEPVRLSLHGLGGFTTHARPSRAWMSLLVSLAGPAAGLGLVVLGLALSWVPTSGFLAAAVAQLVVLNLVWSVFNLLPIVPLDGGHALAALLRMLLEARTAARVTLSVSLVSAVGLALLALARGELFVLLFAGMFASQNLRQLRATFPARAPR